MNPKYFICTSRERKSKTFICTKKDTNSFEDTSKFNEHCTTIWTKISSDIIPVYFIASAKNSKNAQIPTRACIESTCKFYFYCSPVNNPRQAHDKGVSSALSASTSSVVQPIAKSTYRCSSERAGVMNLRSCSHESFYLGVQ